MKVEEKRTRELLMEVAAKEFLNYGFQKASLRKICEKAGVTTGALYFFFKNKEDLFSQLVSGAISELKGLISTVAEDEMKGKKSSSDVDQEIMKFLWKHKIEVQLLLEKSKGTKYEHFKEEVQQKLEQGFAMFYEQYSGHSVDEHLVRILAAMRMQGYLSIVNGGYELEEALRLSDLIGTYADEGFKHIIPHN
ncbi:MAG: TetR/AcrR family transcriptional regulator [Lachnospiraceae bacterium]|nr:TetR/AcrR family transcriptional regulator [Lachnospiraceae bacterium]